VALDNLQDVLLENLKDLYNAEKQLTKGLPKMVKAANSDELRSALQEHLDVTEGQVQRLEDIFKELGVPARGQTCEAMRGLIEEGQSVLDLKRESDPNAFDAALIAAAQRVEHYEIAAYGSCRAFADVLGLDSVSKLLQETLDEESDANEKLTSLAEGGINQAAARAAEEGVGEEIQSPFGKGLARSGRANGHNRGRR
jgi:ferritin-like metal-binding protein YciE